LAVLWGHESFIHVLFPLPAWNAEIL
jgi:hypothetical protein